MRSESLSILALAHAIQADRLTEAARWRREKRGRQVLPLLARAVRRLARGTISGQAEAATSLRPAA